MSRRKYRCAVQPDLSVLTSSGELYTGLVLNAQDAARVRDYWRAVCSLVATGETSGLVSLGSIAVTDLHRVRYELLTDVDQLLHLFNSLTDSELDRLCDDGDPAALESGDGEAE